MVSVMLSSGAVTPASQEFADDIKVLLVNPDTDGPAVREAFLINQRASGVGQSVGRFAALMPGGWQQRQQVYSE